MKSTGTFKRFFYENLTTGAALGDTGGGFSADTPFSHDFYATGNNQIPKGGAVLTRSGELKRNRKRRKRKGKR
jgi:hypothetical protein